MDAPLTAWGDLEPISPLPWVLEHQRQRFALDLAATLRHGGASNWMKAVVGLESRPMELYI